MYFDPFPDTAGKIPLRPERTIQPAGGTIQRIRRAESGIELIERTVDRVMKFFAKNKIHAAFRIEKYREGPLPHIPDRIDEFHARLLRDRTEKRYHFCNRLYFHPLPPDNKFESGKTAYVEVGTYNFIAMPRFYLQCEKGSAIIEDWRKNAQVARMKAWNEKEVLPVQTAAGITKTMAPRDEVTLDMYEAERPVSDVHDFYRNFCAALDGKEQSLITHAQVRRVMQVMEAAFSSSDKKQATEVNI